jgi:predicted O-linked N-acetylglucosamine transferase (SPINDLY family)
MTDAQLQDALRAHQSGDLDRAARGYGDILKAQPKNFDALYLLGFLHLQRGAIEDGEALIGEALSVNPRSVDALYQRGRALLQLGRLRESLAHFDRALSLRPGIPEILLLRGNALLALNRASEALATYDAALAGKPDFPEAWNNRGNALAALSRQEEALGSYDRALAGRPGDIGALHHRALTLLELKRYEEAADAFARVLDIDPEFPYARGNHIYCKLNACNWSGFEAAKTAIAQRLESVARVVTPIQLAAFSSSRENQLRAARIWAADKYPPAAKPLWRGERYRHQKIRIAYLSADFHSHATAALMAGVFEAHDRARFEIAGVSFGPDDRSPMRNRIGQAFERFIDIREKSDAEAAGLLRQMEIDIAVDLKGYTQDSRPGILSLRPAPVQVNYLGFPGTMGTDTIDSIIADETVVPREHARFYTEKIAYLPDSYQGNDRKRSIAESTPSRAEACLPERGFVFCCFNNNFKILPETFAIWMRLLSAVDGSVLWLLEDTQAAARNLRREAGKRGLSPDRLVFAARAGLEAHLARHRLADLFLDTLPYNAHTTASDALWAGLPLVTCLGETFPGRVAASLLRAAGLPELVTDTFDDYEALALKLAREPRSLALLKAKLGANRETCPLFDTSRFTRNLEALFASMWERAKAGERPRDLPAPGGPAKLA